MTPQTGSKDKRKCRIKKRSAITWGMSPPGYRQPRAPFLATVRLLTGFSRLRRKRPILLPRTAALPSATAFPGRAADRQEMTPLRHHLSPLLRRRSKITFESAMILLAYDLYIWYTI
jgi:hypothetical protein